MKSSWRNSKGNKEPSIVSQKEKSKHRGGKKSSMGLLGPSKAELDMAKACHASASDDEEVCLSRLLGQRECLQHRQTSNRLGHSLVRERSLKTSSVFAPQMADQQRCVAGGFDTAFQQRTFICARD